MDCYWSDSSCWRNNADCFAFYGVVKVILLIFGITFTAVGIILVIIAILAAASVTNLRLAIRIHWGEAFIHGRLFALIAGIVIALIGAICLVFHFIG